MQKYTENRPWGNFQQFCLNTPCSVKILSINPHEEFSLQYHNKRDEFWKLIEGQAQITIQNEVYSAAKGDEFYIPKLSLHRIKALDSLVQVLEISFGEFDEQDIVRIRDKYSRI